ncbi:carbohydrate ABC transporter permease [Cellulomonas sp. URHD0024]|uniref:carbohydrate ABC transporter permease n=1 Tax=Cellulomonas sp. URHD0024 TaxID=1302620 RepID=UPI0009DC0CCE|nr:carbohydrate ABC transporter permease [Cellulomonas sp. URHD0024]
MSELSGITTGLATGGASGGLTGVSAGAGHAATVPNRSRISGRSVTKVVLSLVGVGVALAWVFPVYFMISSSLLPNVRLSSGKPIFFPTGARLANYRAVLESGTFYTALRMSIAVTVLTVIITIMFAFLGALAISRFKFRGRKSFILAVLFIQMLPAEGLFIAQYKLVGSLHLMNSVIGVTMIYVAAVVPFTIWMLRGFVAGVPAELEEAAMVDGLSRTRAFLRITFPLLAPGLIASGVFAFLQAWNEFTVALVVLQTDTSRTLPLWLRGFVQTSSTKDIDWGQVMAASSLIAVPVIIFFLFVQGRLTSGLVSGAVKG